MNVFFDVDYTLITWDYRLRPHVREVFARLRDDGHTIYLWSGMGKRWEVVKRFHLHDLIADCFDKPLYNHVARLPELEVTVYPDYVIDDHADPVLVFGGYHIPAPRTPLDEDDEMLRVYDAIRLHVQDRAIATAPSDTSLDQAAT
ncbi:MAG: hypothetical protein HYX51_06230 [Chloroflexi bacterium]|nr:hypothetical protein [Chloroflexota bacterium]